MAKRKNFLTRLAEFLPRRSWYLAGRPVLSLRRLISLAWLKGKRKLGHDHSFTFTKESQVPIDIYMPTLEKDAYMLEHAIDYARKNIRHPISNIYVVAAGKSKKLQALCKKKKCVFIDEKSVINLNKADINYSFNGINKNGWIYKMLLNLCANEVCEEENILVLDSDTLFIAPQVLLHHNKPMFHLSDEYHPPYFAASKNILGVPHKSVRSYITHYQVFNARVLEAMHKELEERWGTKWYLAIIEQMDRSTAMAFADYESYADYYTARYPGQYELNYWSNVSFEIDQLPKMQQWIDQEVAAGMHRSISFHTYLKNSFAKHEA